MKKFTLFLLCLIFYRSSESLINKGPQKTKVCVIGAGPSGISTTRFLAKNLDKFEITVFEKAHDVGGQWLYSDKTGVDEYGYPVHSSIYKYMRLNGPKETNIFPDWPEISGNTSFVSHTVLEDYLRNYTNYFNLKRFIKFNTIVENVSLVKTKTSEKWIVRVKNLISNKIKKFTFDAVIVCNGHFTVPSIPKISGLENFKGQVLHGHSYRKPQDFKNKNVIVLGAGTSGIDIGQELLAFSSKVYLSHNHEKLPLDGFIQIPGIAKFENGKFVLRDNSSVSADVILFATGYKYSFPFLDKSAEITVDNNYVSPLYKHMINVLHPSLSFVGVPVAEFPSFILIPYQAQYVVSVLKGTTKLPSKSVMLEDSKLKTDRKKDAHLLEDGWGFLDDLIKSAGLPPFPEYLRTAIKIMLDYREKHINFRGWDLVISSDKKDIKIVELDVPYSNKFNE